MVLIAGKSNTREEIQGRGSSMMWLDIPGEILCNLELDKLNGCSLLCILEVNVKILESETRDYKHQGYYYDTVVYWVCYSQ